MPRFSDKVFPRPVRKIEVAPGVEILPVDLRRIPAIGVFFWKPVTATLKNGKTIKAYVPMEQVHEAWLRISEVERLPFGLSKETLRKLVKGGFVEGGRAAPNAATVNVISLLEHIEATRADFDFWNRENRRQRFDLGVDLSEDPETTPAP